jgi:hypothetical protein
MRCRTAGLFAAASPSTKNVARAPYLLNVSRSCGVYWDGPSSNVRAMVFGTVQCVMTWPVGTRLARGDARALENRAAAQRRPEIACILLDTEVDAGGEELSGQNKTKKKKKR